MAKPTVAETIKFLTTTEAARELDISRPMLRRRINQSVFPPPVHTNEYNLWFFDEAWLKRAKLTLACEHGKITRTELETALERLNTKEDMDVHQRTTD